MNETSLLIRPSVLILIPLPSFYSTHAFVHWQKDWEADLAKKEAMTHEQRLAAEVQSRNAVELELAKVRQELADARKAMAEGRGQEAERERQLQEQLEAERVCNCSYRFEIFF